MYPSQGHPYNMPPHPAYPYQRPPGMIHQPAGPPEAQSNTDSKGRRWILNVRQQPIRARMCGFGDKDRRPITPPPCICLEVIDPETGKPIDPNDIDPTYLVLTVDLWSQEGTAEVNLVRHSATSPSISATTASSYPPPPHNAISYPYGAPFTHATMGSTYGTSYQYQQPGPAYHPVVHQQYPAPQPHLTPGTIYPAPMNPPGMIMQTQDPRSAPAGMFTRNLIGSLAVSAARLHDTQKKLGIWFILQDLSVRTEGNFRLKMSLSDVSQSAVGGKEIELNRVQAPILATCYSEPFLVFSAKKFPGVIESTALSKCFAQQGVKIPIRKDGSGRQDDEE